jgi:hypothetical protein
LSDSKQVDQSRAHESASERKRPKRGNLRAVLLKAIGRMLAMKSSLIALALLLSGTAVPAFAVMEPAANVGLWDIPSHATVESNFTGDIIAFTARGNADVNCRGITASFANGETAVVYRGTLAPDDQVKAWLPGGARNIRRMDFDCYAIDRGRAVLNVAADMTPPAYAMPLG